MKLSEITNITSGINERRGPQGNVYYLGGSDFTDDHKLDHLLEPSINHSSKLNKHYLKKGDVLILSKGYNGFIARCYQGLKSPAVASSIFMVLRDINSIVLPEYLAWFINLRSTQNLLTSYGRGSALPAINKRILGDVEIQLTDIKSQKQIVALDKLKKNEINLILKLENLKEIKLEHQLKNKIR